MDTNPKIDVVIPVYRPGKEFHKLLDLLDRQTVPVRTVWIMHTEDGRELPSGESYGFRLMTEELLPEEYDHGGTRDRAVRKSDADIVICMTQDALPCDGTLVENLIRPLGKDQVAVSYARQMPRTECRLLERYTRSFNYPAASRLKSAADLEILGIKTYFCSNVCAAYNRQIYEKLGGFEKKTIFNEDMIYAAKCIREGYFVAYEADAKVIHSHNYTRREQFSRNFDLAVSQADHPEIFKGVPSEGEGLRLVKSTAVYLMKKGKFWLIPSLVTSSGFKFLGYRLGKSYKRLPMALIMKCTMNPGYWKNRN